MSNAGTNRKVFFSNTFALAVMQVGKYIFPLLTLPYLARVLTPDGYALRAFVVAFMVFMQTIIDFGFSQYGTKIVALHADKPEILSSISGNVYAAKTILTAIAFFITLIAIFVSPIMFANILFVLVSFMATAFKSFLPDYAFQGLQNMTALTKRFVSTQLLVLLFIFLFVRAPEQLILIPAIEGLMSLVALVWSEWYIRNIYSVSPKYISARLTKKVILGSAPFFVAVASSSFMANTITVCMGFFLPNLLVLSYWSIATTVLVGLQALWQPISRSLLPHMVKKRDVDLIKKILLLGLPIIIVVGVIAFYGADFIMCVLGGERYRDGAFVLQGILPTLLFSYPVSILGYPVIGALGRAMYLSICVAISGFVQLVVLIIAGVIGCFDIYLVIIVRIFSEALLCLLECIVAFRVLRRV